jgi:hypothetical protein
MKAVTTDTAGAAESVVLLLMVSLPRERRLSRLRHNRLVPRFTPPKSQSLEELSARLLACEDDGAATALGEKLRGALHDYVEELRRQLKSLHRLSS